MFEDQTQTEMHCDSDPFESGSVLVHLCKTSYIPVPLRIWISVAKNF